MVSQASTAIHYIILILYYKNEMPGTYFTTMLYLVHLPPNFPAWNRIWWLSSSFVQQVALIDPKRTYENSDSDCARLIISPSHNAYDTCMKSSPMHHNLYQKNYSNSLNVSDQVHTSRKHWVCPLRYQRCLKPVNKFLHTRSLSQVHLSGQTANGPSTLDW